MIASLHRLIYVSRATCPSSQSLLGLSQILAEADRNNRRDRVTGLLLAHDGWFLQALEGPRVPLDRLLRDLRHDPRHDSIGVLVDEIVTERAFGDWGMAHARLNPAVGPALQGVRLGDLSPKGARDLLHRVSADLAGTVAA